LFSFLIKDCNIIGSTSNQIYLVTNAKRLRLDNNDAFPLIVLNNDNDDDFPLTVLVGTTKLTIMVEESDTITYLKSKIFEEINIEPNNQRLVSNGHLLDKDDTTLDDYYISKYSVIRVFLNEDRSNTLHLKLKFNKTLTDIKLDAMATVLDVKLLFSQMNLTSTPIDELLLHFGNEELDDNRALSIYNIKNGATLTITLEERDEEKIPFHILQLFGFLDVNETEHESDDKLTKAFMDADEINGDEFFYDDQSVKQDSVLLNRKRLYSKSVSSKMIPTEMTHSITFIDDDKTEVTDDETANSKILANGVRPADEINDDELFDDDQSVKQDSVLLNRKRLYSKSVPSKMIPTEMTLLIKTMAGLPFKLKFHHLHDDLVIHVKNLIFIQIGLDPSTQSLYFADKVLEDDQLLNDVGIRDGSNLNLAIKLRTGSLQFF
jgi:hypothetical protein